MNRRRLFPVPLILLLLALLAGDGDWWHRDWWHGRVLSPMLPDTPDIARLPAPACLRDLAASGAGYVRVADFATDSGCRVDAAVRVHEIGGAAMSAPFLAGCPLALALQRFAVDTLQPAARQALGSDIARIDHLGSFACRRIRGRPQGPLSEHAFARALDISGFLTEDGRAITVAGNWKDAATDEGRFLRRIAARRRPFTTLITPDHDRRHADHFHFGVRAPFGHVAPPSLPVSRM